ncbi:hypothetical protein [Methylobacterium durans]|uniref:Uncharacterized protein n=1 Tax=Methylobacterium durans TaxID=2202825 RepID=A0A2U8VZP0_9HYPH|nr:hypothetical protein [Methylobacterium durans]AWN39283.1 hypothetical protein DK389_00300 [Methylobacterium durans]
MLVADLRALAETLRATVQTSRELATRAEARNAAGRLALESLLITQPVEPVEGVIDGLAYACEHSAAYGDPAVDTLIRTALYLVGRRVAAIEGAPSEGLTLH